MHMEERHPVNSPVEVGSFSHHLQRFIYIQPVVGNGISEPSTVGLATRPQPRQEISPFDRSQD